MYKASIELDLKDRVHAKYSSEDRANLDLIEGKLRYLTETIEKNTDTFSVDSEGDKMYLEDCYNSCYEFGISEYYSKFRSGFLDIDQHLIRIKESVSSLKFKNVIRKLQSIAKHKDAIFTMQVLASDKTDDGKTRVQSFHEIKTSCEEYVLLLLYNLLGSRHIGETEKINNFMGINWIHNHGYRLDVS